MEYTQIYSGAIRTGWKPVLRKPNLQSSTLLRTSGSLLSDVRRQDTLLAPGIRWKSRARLVEGKFVQISTSHRFIFIHIFKTAGTSVRSALNPYVDRREYLLWNFVRRRLGFPPPDPYPGLSSHAHADEIQAKLPPEIFNSYFKFAFVRNPWDLQVSMYTYIMRWRAHHEHAAISKLGGFEEFLRYRVDHPTWSQKCFVADKSGRQIIDLVGRFENMEADFAHVCGKVGIHTSLPRLNRSKHQDYRTYYTDRGRSLVEQICGEDVAYFGYAFDPVTTIPA